MNLKQVKNRAKSLHISTDCGQGIELKTAKIDLDNLEIYTFKVLKPTREEFFKIFGFAVNKFY